MYLMPRQPKPREYDYLQNVARVMGSHEVVKIDTKHRFLRPALHAIKMKRADGIVVTVTDRKRRAYAQAAAILREW